MTLFRRFLGVFGKPEDNSSPVLVRVCRGSRAAVASKESEDLDELRGVKSLISGLLFEFSVLERAPSRRK